MKWSGSCVERLRCTCERNERLWFQRSRMLWTCAYALETQSTQTHPSFWLSQLACASISVWYVSVGRKRRRTIRAGLVNSFCLHSHKSLANEKCVCFVSGWSNLRRRINKRQWRFLDCCPALPVSWRFDIWSTRRSSIIWSFDVTIALPVQFFLFAALLWRPII